MSEPRVAVVGAGVVGLACAWELRRARRRRASCSSAATVGGGVSRGNTGWVCAELHVPAAGSRDGARGAAPARHAAARRSCCARASIRPSCAGSGASGGAAASARFDAGIRALLALNRANAGAVRRLSRRRRRVRDARAPASSSLPARRAGSTSTVRIFRRLRELGYEGGAIDELDAAALAALEPALDRERRRRRPARARRPLRAPRELTAGLAERLRGRRRRDPRRLRAPRARATERRLGARDRRAAGARRAGRGRRRPADRPPAAPPRRARAARGRARLQRHARRPRHAAAARALPRGGEARPEPLRRRRAVAGVFELGRADAERSPGAGERLLAAARPYLGGWRPDAGRPGRGVGRAAAGDAGRPAVDRSASRHSTASTSPPGTGCSASRSHRRRRICLPLVLEGRAAPELAPFDPARRV